jgi:endonuclease/exonuclease/phosphatase family metal-dependent hydrolase
VCTVHAGLDFEIGKAHQAKQVKQAYRYARKQAPTIPLIFGGDFNVTPSSNALDVVYYKGGGGASGAMEEVDACPGKHGRAHHSASCNQHTHDKTPNVKHRTKNDFIFGSRKSFKGLSGVVVPSAYSDHDMLVGHLYECSSGIC